MFTNSVKRIIREFNPPSVYQNLTKFLSPKITVIKFSDSEPCRLEHTSSMACPKVVDFKELKELLNDKNNVVIDVREPEELQESGRIEGASHIPLGEVSQALQLGSENFKAKYGFSKPSADTRIIFSCRSGKRSALACESAEKLGFKNAWNYSGGFLDWSEQTKEK